MQQTVMDIWNATTIMHATVVADGQQRERTVQNIDEGKCHRQGWYQGCTVRAARGQRHVRREEQARSLPHGTDW